MIERLIRWGVPRYVGGPARSWIYTGLALTGLRLVRKSTGRREKIDVGSVGKGQKIIIEHVPETHAQQLQAEKRAKKAAASEAKAAKKVRRAERRVARQTRRAERAGRRGIRRAARQERVQAWAAARRAGRASAADSA